MTFIRPVIASDDMLQSAHSRSNLLKENTSYNNTFIEFFFFVFKETVILYELR